MVEVFCQRQIGGAERMNTMLGKEGPLRTETKLRVIGSPRCGSDVWATEQPVFLRKAGKCALTQFERMGTQLDPRSLLWAPVFQWFVN